MKKRIEQIDTRYEWKYLMEGRKEIRNDLNIKYNYKYLFI